MTNLGSDDVKSALNTVLSELLKIVDKLEEEDVRYFVWNVEDIPATIIMKNAVRLFQFIGILK